MRTIARTYERAGIIFASAVSAEATTFEEERVVTAIAKVLMEGGTVHIEHSNGCFSRFIVGEPAAAECGDDEIDTDPC